MQRRTLYGFVLLFFLLAGLAYYWLKGANRYDQDRTAPALSISAADLAIAFEKNESLADSLYLYKVLSVSGLLRKVGKNKLGNYVATLESRQPGIPPVDCTLDTLYNRQRLSLRIGDSITILGTCAGHLQNVTLLQGIIEK